MQESLEPIFTEEKKRGADSSINVEKLLSKIIAYWPLYAVFIVVACLLAFVYLRYTTPKYAASAKVLIKDEAKNNTGEGQIMQDLGLQTNAANVENEVEILKSRTLMKKVVADMQTNIHYYAPGRIKTSEYYYKELPFRFEPLFDNSDVQFRFKYKLDIGKDGSYTISDRKRSVTAHWGDTITLEVGKAVLTTNANPHPAYADLTHATIEIKTTEYQAIRTQRKLKVKPVNKASILELSITDALPRRGEDVLNKLIEEYQQANVDDRNKTLDATVEFINDRLVGVNNELSDIEQDIEHFKSTNRLTDLSEQSKLLLGYTSEYEKQLTDNEVKLRVVESLEEYLKNEANKDRIVPSSLLVEDDAAMNAMKSYNDLQLKKSTLLLTNTEANPFVKNLDIQLANIRQDLMRSLASMKQGIEVSIKELKSRSGSVDNQIRQVPRTERIYLEYSRQQNIKQELYLYLLKKREETAISKSSTIANARVIDPAKSDSVPSSPNSGRVYLAAIALGLMLPSGWVFTRELFNIKVGTKEDVKTITRMPIAGEIGHRDGADEIVVQKESKTVIAEQFRTLRTNMQFLLGDDEQKTVMLTSSMSGEGKSFVALNLAVTLALSGKKVVLMELDLRKPKISEHLALRAGKGFTQYVIGQAGVSDIQYPSGIVDSLYIVPSGSIPPNPSELIMSVKVGELFAELNKNYDYIVVDSAPVGLVTDAQLLNKYANVVLYVSRMNYTFKEQLRNADELHKSGRMNNMSLVLNDVKSRTGVYGYGYGYGNYDDGYGSEGKNGIFSKITGSFKRRT